jgi:sulfur-carrier protein
MPTVIFAPVLQRHVESPPLDVAGRTVRAALDAAFSINPRVRGYVLDDQGALRKHMLIFVDGKPITDRVHQSDTAGSESRIYILQSLSGG